MTWPTHSTVALAGLWLIYTIEPDLACRSFGILVAAAVLGGLLPDLDAADSKLQRLALPTILGVTDFTIRPFHLLSRLIRRSSPHRGWMHSLCGLAIASTGMAVALTVLSATSTDSLLPFATATMAWMAFAMGYASHLLCDMATPGGIPLRYPQVQRWHLLPLRWRIPTASWGEELVFAIFACIALAFLFMIMSSVPTLSV